MNGDSSKEGDIAIGFHETRGGSRPAALLRAIRIRHAPSLRVGVLVFAGYYLGAKLGLALTFLPNPVSVLWPPNAVLFAALLLVPTQAWWIVIASALPAHLLAELQGGIPVSMVLSWFLSNVTEALIGAACVRSLVRRRATFATLYGVVVFLGAALLAAFLSSFLDSALVALNRWGQAGYWDVWATRLLSNVTASWTVVPLIVTLASGDFASVRSGGRARLVEAAVLVAGLLVITYFVFDSTTAAHLRPVIYLPFPFLLWAALRFGPAGASLSFAVVTFLVIWGAGHDLGPFASRSHGENAISVQLFLIFVAPTLLCLAAAVEERRRSAESLRLSDRRFQLVLEATRDCVYERDAATDQLWWSGNRLVQFGYARGTCPGDFASWERLIHPDDRERAVGHLTTCVESGQQLWESEFRLRRADGSHAHVHEQGFIVRDYRGRPLQMIGALTDITERRNTDELSHRLAHASRLTAMGELTASIAHEISQPMSAILSNVDAAEMLLDAGEHHSGELRQILEDIRNDDLRASEVIRHIRGLAKKRDTDFEPFDVNALVEDVLRLVSPVARRRGVVLGAELMPVLPVHGDRIYVQQVLLNLLFNGMDAMSATAADRRLLRVRTAGVEGDKVEVSVRDSGHGIPHDKMDRVFESFFTTKKDGMGLGLSIARSLIQAHGGRIRAENNRDGGATFRFTLPVSTESDLSGRYGGGPR
jgi:PAS domain S-box-containing protein